MALGDYWTDTDKDANGVERKKKTDWLSVDITGASRSGKLGTETMYDKRVREAEIKRNTEQVQRVQVERAREQARQAINTAPPKAVAQDQVPYVGVAPKARELKENPHLKDVADAGDAARRQALADLQRDADAQAKSLAKHFNFGEDPAAREVLRRTLDDLNRQKSAAAAAINTSYGQGIAAANAGASRVAADSVVQGKNVAALYNDAAKLTASLMGTATADTGLGSGGDLGVGTVAFDGNVAAAPADIAATGAAEGAAAQQIAKLTADDLTSMGVSMGGQRGAQQGSLQRLIVGMGAEAQLAHAQREAERQYAEQLAYRDRSLAMQDRFTARRDGLVDEGRLSTDDYNRGLAQQWQANEDYNTNRADNYDDRLQTAKGEEQRRVDAINSQNALIQSYLESQMGRNASRAAVEGYADAVKETDPVKRNEKLKALYQGTSAPIRSQLDGGFSAGG